MTAAHKEMLFPSQCYILHVTDRKVGMRLLWGVSNRQTPHFLSSFSHLDINHVLYKFFLSRTLSLSLCCSLLVWTPSCGGKKNLLSVYLGCPGSSKVTACITCFLTACLSPIISHSRKYSNEESLSNSRKTDIMLALPYLLLLKLLSPLSVSVIKLFHN